MPTTRKNLTPKHVMLKHDPIGVARSGATRSDVSVSAYPVTRKRVPFSPGWIRTLILGYHSPTWATALALSTMLLSDDMTRRISMHKAEQHSPQNHEKPNAGPLYSNLNS